MNKIKRRDILSLLIAGGFFNTSLVNAMSGLSYNQAYGSHRRQVLDVYLTSSSNRPVIVFLHGGGWRRGDKRLGKNMGQFFSANGFNFVAINYRLHPEVDAHEQAQDVASALKFLVKNSQKWSMDDSSFGLIGHSAGAHLAALTALNGRYFNNVDLERERLKAVVLLDGACYDIPRQIKDSPGVDLYTEVFTTDIKKQIEFSPITYALGASESARFIPAFQIHHVARRIDSKEQSNALAQKINASRKIAEVHSAIGESHATIQRNFGESDHETTKKTLSFFNQHLK